MSNSTLYATLRLKRRPISNEVICLKLVCSFALPVHKSRLHEEDLSDHSTQQQVTERLQALAAQFRCAHVELDVRGDVTKRLERNW
jgi:hypothetical protein